MRGIDPTPVDRRADAYGFAVGVLLLLVGGISIVIAAAGAMGVL